MNPTFADRLKYWRASMGMTQKELAGRLGVTRQAVYYWETGRREPSISRADEIVHALYVLGMPEITADKLLIDDLPEDYYE